MVVKNNFLSPDASVLFATFSLWTNGKRMPTNGSVEPLRNFLVPRIKKLVLIDQLVPGSEDVLHKIEVYLGHSMKYQSFKPSWWFGFIKPILQIRNTDGTHISFKIRDFLSIIDWILRDNTVFDYFIGLESVNTIAGILLRKIGRVKKVVYYVSDYSPQRYKNSWFNHLYLAFDRFSAKHADYIWDVSRAIHPARIKAGLNKYTSAPVIHVNNGLNPWQIKTNPLRLVQPHSIVYMGTLGADNGPDIAILALAIVRKKYKDATLHIIGGTPHSFAWLAPIIKKAKVQSAVLFYGFVPDSNVMSNIIRRCSIGVSPYRAIPGSPRYYGDAGKIRAYCASGLPIVTSPVPPLGQDVAKLGAALIADDNPQSTANAIIKIFGNTRMYMAMRKKALAIAKINTWDNQFTFAFQAMAQKNKT